MTYRELLNEVKNLDDEVDLSLLNNKKKAYIYLSGSMDKKIYIDGDTCYEVSEKIPGRFLFSEAQEIVKWFDLIYYNGDWRLPTKDEFKLIYNTLRCYNQIKSDDTDWYWTSTSYEDTEEVWTTRLADGNYDHDFKRLVYFCVRAIRSFKLGD